MSQRESVKICAGNKRSYQAEEKAGILYYPNVALKPINLGENKVERTRNQNHHFLGIFQWNQYFSVDRNLLI